MADDGVEVEALELTDCNIVAACMDCDDPTPLMGHLALRRIEVEGAVGIEVSISVHGVLHAIARVKLSDIHGFHGPDGRSN